MILGKQARKVTEDQAMSCVGGYCLALDMTARWWVKDHRQQKCRWDWTIMAASGISRMRLRRKATPGLLLKYAFQFPGAPLKGTLFKMKNCQMFDTSLPVSPLIPLDAIPDPHNVSLWCKVAEWNVEFGYRLLIAGKWGAQTRGQHQGHDLHFAKTYLLHIYIFYPE